jgi:hypothetical protein
VLCYVVNKSSTSCSASCPLCGGKVAPQFLHACCILMLQGMVFLIVLNGLDLVNRVASSTQYFVSLSSHSICLSVGANSPALLCSKYIKKK